MTLRGIVRGTLAVAILAGLLAREIVAEVWGRWRHGKAFEPGDGLGREEDYV